MEETYLNDKFKKETSLKELVFEKYIYIRMEIEC
jgi:hypothetical protein